MTGRGARRAGGGDVDIAAVGALVADPARCRMLLALADGRALPAGRLAADAGVSAPTASSHLGKLAAGGLVVAEVRGRYRYYRLAGPEVAELLEALERLAPVAEVRSLRQSQRAAALRAARSCYDHLGGRLGVELLRALVDHGHLTDDDFTITASGARFLDGVGVVVAPGRRRAHHHVDPSEEAPHLAGPLGRALFERFAQLRWVEPSPSSRAVVVTELGRHQLLDRLGIELG